MKSHSASKRILIEEVTNAAKDVRVAARGLTIGAWIRSIRLELGMSQQVLAKRAGVPQSTVSRVEGGREK
jgi:DNA-binding transcriptional regulator YiaG